MNQQLLWVSLAFLSALAAGSSLILPLSRLLP